MHDRDAFLAGAVRRDQHRRQRARDAQAGQRVRHRVGSERRPPSSACAGDLAARARSLRARASTIPLDRFDTGEQLRVVGFAVVGGTGRRMTAGQPRPAVNRITGRSALRARIARNNATPRHQRRIGAEVHVLGHQVDGFTGQRRPAVGRVGATRALFRCSDSSVELRRRGAIRRIKDGGHGCRLSRPTACSRSPRIDHRRRRRGAPRRPNTASWPSATSAQCADGEYTTRRAELVVRHQQLVDLREPRRNTIPVPVAAGSRSGSNDDLAARLRQAAYLYAVRCAQKLVRPTVPSAMLT